MTSPSRAALVTGANRGLGLEITRQLIARGFTVYAGAREPTDIPDIGGDVRRIRLDVTDSDAIASAASGLGRLDVLVNNAGVGEDPAEPVLAANLDVVRGALETNAFGAWRLAMACSDLLQASAHGRIVNISSGVASMNDASEDGLGYPAYFVSKTALNAITLLLADAMRPSGVLVNAVCPGWVATDMGGPGGRPVSDGAAGVVWAATLEDDGPTGGFFRDRLPLNW
jgi:NAD(P)-dependent dehydrogenase (short-subunit alcohol dehydrogenase family)